MPPKDLLLRFDANNQIGIGHAVRCIEIAKYIKENSKLKVIVCTSRDNLMLEELSVAKVTDNILFYNHNTEEEFIEFISSVYPNSMLMLDKLYNYSRNFIKGIWKNLRQKRRKQQLPGLVLTDLNSILTS